MAATLTAMRGEGGWFEDGAGCARVLISGTETDPAGIKVEFWEPLGPSPA